MYLKWRRANAVAGEGASPLKADTFLPLSTSSSSTNELPMSSPTLAFDATAPPTSPPTPIKAETKSMKRKSIYSPPILQPYQTPAETIQSGLTIPHVQPKSTQRAERYSCDYPGCGKAYTAKFSLKRHLKKHTGEKEFICDDASCGKSFPEKWQLKRHKKHCSTKDVSKIDSETIIE